MRAERARCEGIWRTRSARKACWAAPKGARRCSCSTASCAFRSTDGCAAWDSSMAATCFRACVTSHSPRFRSASGPARGSTRRSASFGSTSGFPPIRDRSIRSGGSTSASGTRFSPRASPLGLPYTRARGARSLSLLSTYGPHDRLHGRLLRRIGREFQEVLEVHRHTVDALDLVEGHAGFVVRIRHLRLELRGLGERVGGLRLIVACRERQAELVPGLGEIAIGLDGLVSRLLRGGQIAVGQGDPGFAYVMPGIVFATRGEGAEHVL